MARISGVDLQPEKITKIALTRIYGVGRRSVEKVLVKAQVDGQKRVKDLTDEETARLQKTIETSFKVEGDLRKEVSDDIARLKQIGSYRGKRHAVNLPVRGQRTRTNARTKRGKRVTIGALRKEALVKQEQTEKLKEEKR
jgi:small subunit ribosomal protein S13